MTDAAHPICSVCRVPLKEKRTRFTFRQWCPQCGQQTAFFRAWLDDVPPFVRAWVERREATRGSRTETLDNSPEQA